MPARPIARHVGFPHLGLRLREAGGVLPATDSCAPDVEGVA